MTGRRKAAATNSSGIKFEELPPSGQGGPISQWGPITAELKARPGEWAKIVTRDSAGKASSLAQTIRQARAYAWAPFGAFEAESRGCDVWARYVGGES